MSKLVKMTLGDNTILVEAPDDVQPADGVSTRLSITGNEVLDAVDKTYDELVQNEIVENCRVLTQAFEKLREQSIAPARPLPSSGSSSRGRGTSTS